MATLFPFPSSKAQIRAMSSANWTKVAAGKGLASMVSILETTAYLALFPSKTKLFPSVYQISSGLSEDLLTIPLRVLASGPMFLGKSERGERALRSRQEGGWVKNLTRG